ncbi:MAG: SPOR domain-containing protein [Hyphomicrobiales bacterium]|nr:SPOR domain-containing protein [Hyphomicrobiales bacterium]
MAKTDTTAPADVTDTTPKAPAAAKPARAAKSPPAASDQVASAAAEAPVASDKAGGGDWVVQLAAPRTEADAQHEAARLKKKFADALGGADIGIHKAEIKGDTVFRVRAAGYSKADAAALCAKLKSSGGDCFITRD